MRILVNGEEIHKAAIDYIVRSLQSAGGETPSDGEGQSNDDIRKMAETRVIDETLIAQYLTSPDSPYPDPPEKRIQAEFHQQSDLYEDMSPEKARAHAVRLIKRRMLHKEYKAKIHPPTKEEMRNIYDEKPENFVLEEGYMVTRFDYFLENEDSPSASEAMIELIRLKSEIAKSDNPGTTWFTTIIRHSDSYRPGSKELFSFLLKRDLPAEIAAKLAAAETGEICGPFFPDIETISLFRVEEKLPRRQLSFEESTGLIQKTWYARKLDDAEKSLADKLRETAKIERLDD